MYDVARSWFTSIDWRSVILERGIWRRFGVTRVGFSFLGLMDGETDHDTCTSRWRMHGDLAANRRVTLPSLYPSPSSHRSIQPSAFVMTMHHTCRIVLNFYTRSCGGLRHAALFTSPILESRGTNFLKDSPNRPTFTLPYPHLLRPSFLLFYSPLALQLHRHYVSYRQPLRDGRDVESPAVPQSSHPQIPLRRASA
jgi:hypothetical protein